MTYLRIVIPALIVCFIACQDAKPDSIFAGHALAGAIMNVHGSCLCGSVAFAVDLPFDRFVHRHCSRCRKATGTAHACNAVVEAGALHWLRGQDLTVRYDLPNARSFATSFCQRCGSPLPHLTRSGREVIVPAGSFDSELRVKPERHLHWASRADWYADAKDLPREE